MRRTYDYTTTGWNISTDMREIRKVRIGLSLAAISLALAVVSTIMYVLQ